MQYPKTCSSSLSYMWGSEPLPNLSCARDRATKEGVASRWCLLSPPLLQTFMGDCILWVFVSMGIENRRT